MPPVPTDLMPDPVRHFLDIYQALDSEPAWWSDDAWLRFAAQAAVQLPDEPAEIARSIRAVAAEIGHRAHWYQALTSPLNLVVAATIVQMGMTVDAFESELHAADHLFRSVGFSRAGAHEVKAILALIIVADAAPMSQAVVERMHRIYLELKSHHGWLTGSDDLAACALLTTCRGTPEEIGGIANGIYATLTEGGFRPGNHLQTAANLLTLTGMAASAAAIRFQSLVGTFQTRSIAMWSDDYDGIALLAWLDHEPERVADRFQETLDQLKHLRPGISAEVNINIASDLVFLDLVRYDRSMRPLTEPAETERMKARIRTQRAASLILVKSTPVPVMLGDLGGPMLGYP